jgi:hypothetical protein
VVVGETVRCIGVLDDVCVEPSFHVIVHGAVPVRSTRRSASSPRQILCEPLTSADGAV